MTANSGVSRETAQSRTAAGTLLQDFKEWNAITGALEPGTGWYFEIESIFEDGDAEIERLRVALTHCTTEEGPEQEWLDRARALLAGKAPETSRDPYLVRTFWSPDRRHLVSAHVTREGIVALQDDNGQEWEAAGPQQDMNSDQSGSAKAAARAGAESTAALSLAMDRLQMIIDAAKDGASLTWIRAVAEEGLRGEPLVELPTEKTEGEQT